MQVKMRAAPQQGMNDALTRAVGWKGAESPATKGAESPATKGTESPATKGTESPATKGTESPATKQLKGTESGAIKPLNQSSPQPDMGEALPAGWKRYKSRTNGNFYYYHKETNTTSWKVPKADT